MYACMHVCMYKCMYHKPMGDELKELLKERGGRIFESCDTQNTPTSHTVSLALIIYTCSISAMSLMQLQ